MSVLVKPKETRLHGEKKAEGRVTSNRMSVKKRSCSQAWDSAPEVPALGK